MIPIGQKVTDGVSWPEHPPKELYLRMLDALSYRTCSPSDIWDEMRDWLSGQGVPVPPGVLGEQGAAEACRPAATGPAIRRPGW